MAKPEQIKDPVKLANQKRHQYGQPEGNKPGTISTANSQRDFYRWCETKATEEELRAYLKDKSKPAARRKFIAALMNCSEVDDFFALTNQTHGAPKQTIEVEEIPNVKVEFV